MCFNDCLISDIESLKHFAGIHEMYRGFHRALSKRFRLRSTTLSMESGWKSLRCSTLKPQRPSPQHWNRESRNEPKSSRVSNFTVIPIPSDWVTPSVPAVRPSVPLCLSERSRILSQRHQGTEYMHSCCSGEIYGPRVGIDFGGVNPAAARWNKLCW